MAAAVLAALVLAIVWVIVAAWVVGVVLAAGWPTEQPAGRPADPYAADVAQFRAQLADWDRDGRP